MAQDVSEATPDARRHRNPLHVGLRLTARADCHRAASRRRSVPAWRGELGGKTGVFRAFDRCPEASNPSGG
ncbi:hypothetical protein [Sphingomonas paeninsulae]|nr:hypothetical protein [Sphingomonas paeninsulae]